MKMKQLLYGMIIAVLVIAGMYFGTTETLAAGASESAAITGKQWFLKAIRQPATWAVIFIILDVLSGLLYAFISHQYDSQKMREGGGHKFTLLYTLVFSGVCDAAQSVINIGFSVPILTTVSLYIIFMEICSCVENIGRAYPDALPDKITEMFIKTAKNAGVKNIKNE